MSEGATAIKAFFIVSQYLKIHKFFLCVRGVYTTGKHYKEPNTQTIMEKRLKVYEEHGKSM